MVKTFLPSQVSITSSPFTGTFGRCEAEHAAALMVRTCQALGDRWQPVLWAQIEAVVLQDVKDAREPLSALVRNPFFRADPGELERRGFAASSEHGIAFTEAGMGALARWARDAPPRAIAMVEDADADDEVARRLAGIGGGG